MSLSNHTCPFLTEFIGAIYTEGSVKFALELMDMGSLGNVMKLAMKDPKWSLQSNKPLLPEPVMAKITQQVLLGLSYLNIVMR